MMGRRVLNRRSWKRSLKKMRLVSPKMLKHCLLRIATVPGARGVILPVNLREISVLYGVVLAATGVGGHRQITHGR